MLLYPAVIHPGYSFGSPGKYDTFETMEAENQYEKLSAKLQELEQELSDNKRRIEQLENIIARASQRQTPPQARRPFEKTTLENFVGLKLIHFVGIIVLITGLSIGVKYAIDINLISPALRIVLAYAAGIILLLLSYKLRAKFLLFSMILFSGSMASLYFTSYAAFEYYGMMPKTVAFVLMLCLTVFTVYNALKYNRSQIAILGLVGAYGIPFFVRGNSGDISMLLLYVLLINLGVLFLSFKKYWPDLIRVAFLTSWIIYFSCMYMDDANEYGQALKIFAAAFFVLFLVSGLVFKLYRKIALDDSDTVLLFMNSLAAYIAINLAFAKSGINSWSVSAIIVAFLYLASALASRRWMPGQHFLNNMLFVTGLFGLVGYVALEFSGFTITLIWLLLAILLFVAGMYLRIKILRFISIFLFGLTLLKLLFIDSLSFTAVQKVTGYVVTGTLLLVVSFLYQKFRKRIFDEE